MKTPGNATFASTFSVDSRCLGVVESLCIFSKRDRRYTCINDVVLFAQSVPRKRQNIIVPSKVLFANYMIS